MARTVNRLSALAVSRETRPGMYPDGAGLYLQVRPVQRAGTEDQGKVTRSWIFRFTLGGRTRDMGLGSARDISLAEARIKAREARKLKAAGVDPVAAKASEAAKLAGKCRTDFYELLRKHEITIENFKSIGSAQHPQ